MGVTEMQKARGRTEGVTMMQNARGSSRENKCFYCNLLGLSNLLNNNKKLT